MILVFFLVFLGDFFGHSTGLESFSVYRLRVQALVASILDSNI